MLLKFLRARSEPGRTLNVRQHPRQQVHGQVRRRPRVTGDAPSNKPLSSDQAPGEETVQVNDQYAGDGPAPAVNPLEHQQHQTGG